jgi:hypothetical protein
MIIYILELKSEVPYIKNKKEKQIKKSYTRGCYFHCVACGLDGLLSHRICGGRLIGSTASISWSKTIAAGLPQTLQSILSLPSLSHTTRQRRLVLLRSPSAESERRRTHLDRARSRGAAVSRLHPPAPSGGTGPRRRRCGHKTVVAWLQGFDAHLSLWRRTHPARHRPVLLRPPSPIAPATSGGTGPRRWRRRSLETEVRPQDGAGILQPYYHVQAYSRAGKLST